MRLSGVLCGASATVSIAANLFVSSYSGNVTSLELMKRGGVWLIDQRATTDGCAPNPTWLTLDLISERLYCVDEGLDRSMGHLALFDIDHVDNSTLTLHDIVSTPPGPVSATYFGHIHDNDTIGLHETVPGPPGPVSATHFGQEIALAHYAGGAVSTWLIGQNGSLTNSQKVFRGRDSHPHQAVTWPLKTDGVRWLLVPDLGADRIRVFRDNDKRRIFKLVEDEGLVLPQGIGPRHIAIQPAPPAPNTPLRGPRRCNTDPKLCGGNVDEHAAYIHIANELSNTISTYYMYETMHSLRDGYLTFNHIATNSIFGTNPDGTNTTVPPGSSIAEIQQTNDYLTVSVRNDRSFSVLNPDPSNKTELLEDTLVVWKTNPTGHLKLIQRRAAGGTVPRHFEINNAGDKIAVGLAGEGRVVIFERNKSTGFIGNEIARTEVGGEVTCVRWYEPKRRHIDHCLLDGSKLWCISTDH